MMRGALVLLALSLALSPGVRAGEPKDAPRRDRYGDPLPNHALFRIGTSRTPSDRPAILALTPDGKTLVANSPDPRSVILWDLQARRELRVLTGHQFEITSAAFSPDGKRLATGSRDWTIRIWDPATGKVLQTLEGDSTEVNAVAWAPDGKLLAAASNDLLIRLWDPVAGKTVRELKGHADAVTSVCFSPDGAAIASGSEDKTVRLWDAKTGQHLRTFEEHKGAVLAVVFAPDGKTIASGGQEPVIRQWESGTGKQVREFNWGNDRIGGLTFSGDSKLLYVGDHGAFAVCECDTGKTVHQGGFEDRSWLRVLPLRVAGVPTILVGDSHGTVVFWDPATEKLGASLGSPHGSIDTLAFSAGGKRLALSAVDRTVHVLDAATGAGVARLDGHANRITSIAFSSDGRRLAGGDRDGLVLLHEAATGKLLHTLKGHTADPISLAFSADGRALASGDQLGIIRLWDTARGTETGKLDVHAATADDGTSIPRFVHLVAGEGIFLAGDSAGLCARYDQKTGKSLSTRTLSKPASHVLSCSPDGRMVAAIAPDGTVCVRKTSSGRMVTTIDTTAHGVNCAAFSPDGRFLATAGIDRRVRLWETLTGALAQTFEGHDSQVNCLAFAPDGRTLASGSTDCTALVWDARLVGPAVKALADGAWETVWKELAATDVVTAQRAIAACSLAPDQALAFLKDRLKPVPRTDRKRIQLLVADLDNPRFEVRQTVTAALEKLGEAAEPALLRLLAEAPPLEVRQRVDTLLSRLEKKEADLGSDDLRTLRALRALEQIGTAAALQVVEELAKGAEHSLVTQDAQATLKRWSKK